MDVIDRVAGIIDEDPGLKVAYDPPVEPYRAGTPVPLDQTPLHPRVRNYLTEQFPDGLFTHQHLAISNVLDGRNTVVATRTSSGKSLIYSLPLFDTLCRDEEATALFLYPQKALANDQLLKLRTMADHIEGVADLQADNPRLISRYDGAVSDDDRKAIRERAQVILSNPDMLHMGMLQYHESNWSRFFANLRLVAIDECHEYRGVFGTNVAYILRRLRQICRMHGGTPTFVATSATVQDPQSHMEKLTGLDFTTVGPEHDGSLQGRRKFWMVRNDDHFYDAGRRLAQTLADAGLTVLAFCPSRVAAERMFVRTVRQEDDRASYVRVYRSGLSPQQREEIEQGLRTREVRLVFSTSALELGIDIGEIDVVVCIGLPHTMMSLWQRAGRSARGGREGATVLLPADTPIDGYYSNHPEELFGRDNEPLVLNLQNQRIACQQYACAVQEFGRDDSQLDFEALGSELQAVREARDAGQFDSDIFYCSQPHVEVNVRSGGERAYELVLGDGSKIGEIDHFHLLRECYPNAIYRHGGVAYRVLNVVRGKRLVRLRREYSRNDTVPHLQRRIRLKQQHRVADYGDVRVATASLNVTEFLVSVSEKSLSGDTIDSWQGSSGMGAYRLPTEGTLLAFSRDFWSRLLPQLGEKPQTVLTAVERLFSGLFPTIAGPCDTGDFSSAVDRLVTDENAVFLYDAVYDGADLTSAAFERMTDLVANALERVRQCTCESDAGCFRCIANPTEQELSSRKATATLLDAVWKVLTTVTPRQIETETDWESSFQTEPPQKCNACGHLLSGNPKFCSECGTRVEEPAAC